MNMDDFEMEIQISEVEIDTKDIKKYFFRELIYRGYVPDENEIEELADICFDYLVDVGVIDEEVIDELEEE